MGKMIIVRINDKCQPLDRGDLYEDPLIDAFENSGLGEVTGGGSQLDENYQITYCELEVIVNGDLNKAVELIIETLNKTGIPKGSKIIIDDTEQEFGANEQMAIYFDNVSLPTDVYENNNINDVISDIDEILGDNGKMTSHGRNETCTIVYYTGPSFEKMSSLISDYASKHPLLKNSVVKQSA